MKDYLHNKVVCRRQALFQHFPGSYIQSDVLHNCCDICMSHCCATADVNNVHVTKKGLHHVNYAASVE